MTNTLTKITDDLYETRTDNPAPGLTTHAYLWTRADGNVLFYSPSGETDFDAIEALGGVAHQYLSHEDEAGPNLAAVARRFGSQLHAPAAELATIGRHTNVDVPVAAQRTTDAHGVEIIPTPGHSPGSTSYLITSTSGRAFLFTGDTLFPTEDGTWSTFLDEEADPDALAASLDVLGELRPDVVISSAFAGPTAVVPVTAEDWSRHVQEARDTLPH